MEPVFPAHTGRPVIFGEVLFDSFPDGNEVLGGAPFNVAWHLQGFGLRPLFISRIGDDARGEQVAAAMQGHAMDLTGLQRDPVHPTGEVRIHFAEGSHSFEILADQAYDHIDTPPALGALPHEGASLLYFGSLIDRSPAAAATLQALRSCGFPAFVDVNLRAPWWSVEGVERLLQGVSWGKLNDDELAALGYAGPTNEAAIALSEAHGLEMLVVTRAERGALLVHGGRVLEVAAPPVEEMVDTVGAGDAFSSVVILGLQRGWSAVETLQRAGEFASRICSQRGALPPDATLYGELNARWT